MTLASVAETQPIVNTSTGAVRGVDLGGMTRFYGIPYAAPPVGALRFALPAPHVPWSDVRDCAQKGPVAPQPSPTPEEFEKAAPGLDIRPLVGNGWQGGEDFLICNIWTPVSAQNAPVMVFIHGGSFTGGCGDAEVYDGAAFARDGAVLVTINYRLGVEGFLPIPGAPTNLGLRDQLAALKWVQDNIAAFGGDAGNVTVFGESAGAMSVADLLASPLAKGLFKRAIIESGHGNMVRPIPVAMRLVHKLAKMLKVTPDVAGFRSTSMKDCIEALKRIALPTARIDLRNPDKREPAFGLSRFLPVYGDDVLPEHPMKALENGVGADVEVLIGANLEEMNLYFVPSGVRAKLGKFISRMALGKVQPNASAILKAYGIDDKRKKPGDAFSAALTDLVFRLPARHFAAAHRGKSHLYEFAWRSPMYGNQLGACHGLELPFAFDTLASVSGAKGLAGENPPADVAKRIHKLWVDFARSGALPWPEYDKATRQICVIDTGVVSTDAPMAAEPFA